MKLVKLGSCNIISFENSEVHNVVLKWCFTIHAVCTNYYKPIQNNNFLPLDDAWAHYKWKVSLNSAPITYLTHYHVFRGIFYSTTSLSCNISSKYKYLFGRHTWKQADYIIHWKELGGPRKIPKLMVPNTLKFFLRSTGQIHSWATTTNPQSN